MSHSYEIINADVPAPDCGCGVKESHFHIDDSGPICNNETPHPDWCVAEHLIL